MSPYDDSDFYKDDVQDEPVIPKKVVHVKTQEEIDKWEAKVDTRAVERAMKRCDAQHMLYPLEYVFDFTCTEDGKLPYKCEEDRCFVCKKKAVVDKTKVIEIEVELIDSRRPMQGKTIFFNCHSDCIAGNGILWLGEYKMMKKMNKMYILRDGPIWIYNDMKAICYEGDGWKRRMVRVLYEVRWYYVPSDDDD